MYFVQGDGNLKLIISNLLRTYFGDKASVNIDSYGKLMVKVKEDAGFEDEHKCLTQEQKDLGVCGGGTKLGLNGKTFYIIIKEVDEES